LPGKDRCLCDAFYMSEKLNVLFCVCSM
jgi:hypothetical protein